MNDLDLRTALHRDADLVGEPSPDLLDQLVARRQKQRRQRAGMLTAGLAVVVIAAGVPVGAAFMTRADGGPATEKTVAPTPSITPEVVVPTPPAVTPTVAPVPEPVVQAPSQGSEPECPDFATLQAAMPADTAERWFTIYDGGDGPVCSGIWVAAGYTEHQMLPSDDGGLVEVGDGSAGLWRYGDGSWTFHFRGDYCDVVTLPEVIWQRACNVD